MSSPSPGFQPPPVPPSLQPTRPPAPSTYANEALAAAAVAWLLPIVFRRSPLVRDTALFACGFVASVVALWVIRRANRLHLGLQPVALLALSVALFAVVKGFVGAFGIAFGG